MLKSVWDGGRGVSYGLNQTFRVFKMVTAATRDMKRSIYVLTARRESSMSTLHTRRWLPLGAASSRP